MSNQTTPLVRNPAAIPLYDPQAMISMSKSPAQGYITLLSGGNANIQQAQQSSTVDLGFLAITQGNVLEACFGTTQRPASKQSRKDSPEARSVTQVRRLKLLFAEAADSSEAIRTLAVETYLKAFEIVVQTNDEMDQLNFFTRCFFYCSIVHKAQAELARAFENLQEAIQSSTS